MIRRAIAAAAIALAAVVPAPADGTAIVVPAPLADERFVDWPTEVVLPVAPASQEPASAATSHAAPSWAPTAISGRELVWPALWAGVTGTVSHYGWDSRYDSYVALPWPYGDGWRVRVCSMQCWEGVSTDTGPERRLHRVADLGRPIWEHVCGVPASFGLCVAHVQVFGKEAE